MKTQAQIQADLNAAIKSQSFHRGINDGGEGFNPVDRKVLALRSELAQRQAAEDAKALEVENTRWTLEVTQARRLVWNTEVKALGARKGGKLDAKDILGIQGKLGFAMEQLKRHIVRHGLK